MVPPTRVSTLAKAGALLRITRLENCLAVAICVILGGHLGAGKAGIKPAQLVLAGLVMALVLAYGNVVNDLFDLEVDRLAKPKRPLPSGRISPGFANALAIGLAAAAIGLSLLLRPALSVITLVLVGLSYLYSWRLKGTPLVGNLTIACQTASTVIFGALAVSSLNLRVWLASLMVFWAFVLFEVVKDIEDREGDRQAGIVTIAHLLNPSGYLLLIRFLLLLAALITALTPGLLGLSGSIWYWLVLVPLIPLSLLAGSLPAADHLKRYILASKSLWLVGLIGLWALT